MPPPPMGKSAMAPEGNGGESMKVMKSEVEALKAKLAKSEAEKLAADTARLKAVEAVGQLAASVEKLTMRPMRKSETMLLGAIGEKAPSAPKLTIPQIKERLRVKAQDRSLTKAEREEINKVYLAPEQANPVILANLLKD